jgi:hypothetical protein
MQHRAIKRINLDRGIPVISPVANVGYHMPRQHYDDSLNEIAEEGLSSLSFINVTYKDNDSAMKSIYKLNEKFLMDIFIIIRLDKLPNSIIVYYDPSMLTTPETEFKIILYRTLRHFGSIIPPSYDAFFQNNTEPNFSEQEWNIILYLIGIRCQPFSYYRLSRTCKTFLILINQHISKDVFWKNGIEYVYNTSLDINITAKWSALYGIFTKMTPEDAVTIYGYNRDITNLALCLGMNPLNIVSRNRTCSSKTYSVDFNEQEDVDLDYWKFEESLKNRIIDLFTDEKCNEISELIINHPNMDNAILCEILYNYIYSGNIEMVIEIINKLDSLDLLKLSQEKILKCAYYSTLSLYKYFSIMFGIDQCHIRKNINHFMDLLLQNETESITPDVLNFYDIRFEDYVKCLGRIRGVSGSLILIKIILNDISKGKIIDISLLDDNVSWNICNEIFIRNGNLKGIIFGKFSNPSILYTDRFTPFIVNSDPMKSICWKNL